MIRTTTILKTFLLFLFLSVQQIVDASDIRGAEIQWKHLAGQEYEVSLNYYRDCRGLAADDSKLLKIFCGRGVVADTLFVHAQRSSFRDITPACLGTEPCGSVGNTDSAGAGTEKHIYKATIDFDAGLLDTMRSNGSCAFRFYFEECCRSAGMTTGGAGTPFVVDAEIDLCNLQNSLNPHGDNSPQFRNEPVVDWCCNQQVSFNDGIVDIDGDSLAFSLVAALKSTDSAITYSVPFNPVWWAMTGYCRATSPCACRIRGGNSPTEGFCFDPMTADYTFTPVNCGESGVLVLKVEQFKLDTLAQKWLYVGYTKREVNLRIQNCSNNNPPMIKDIQFPTVCEGEEICMTIVAEDEEYIGSMGVQPWRDTIELAWNKGLPNAGFEVGTPYFTFQNGITTAMREVEICWQTQEGDGREAPYFFAVTARDRVCSNNAVASRAFAVRVKRKAKFEVNDSIQCLKGNLFEFRTTPASLNVHGIWTFGDGSGDTSTNPQKTYNDTGSYTVRLISETINGCTDTTEINVVVKPHPNALPIEGDTSAIISSSTFTYSAANQANHAYFWEVSSEGQIVSGQNTRIVDVLWTDTGWATVLYVLTNSFGCTDTASLQVHVSDTSTLGVYDLEGVSLKLYPNPVRDLLHLQVDKPVKTVKVFDSKGVLVMEKENTEVLDFSKLSSGVYTVYVQDTDGHFIIGKVMKE